MGAVADFIVKMMAYDEIMILYVFQETPEPNREPVTGTGVNRNRLNRIRDS